MTNDFDKLLQKQFVNVLHDSQHVYFSKVGSIARICNWLVFNSQNVLNLHSPDLILGR